MAHMPRPTAHVFLAGALGVGLLAAGCSSDDGGDGGTTSSGATAPTTSATGDRPDAATAMETALAERTGAAVMEVDFEDDENQWEVTVLGGDGDGATEVFVDATTGEIVGDRPATLDPGEDRAPSVSAQDAAETALGEQAGRLTSLDYGSEDGRMMWEAQVDADARTEWEIQIDAESGEVIRAAQD